MLLKTSIVACLIALASSSRSASGQTLTCPTPGAEGAVTIEGFKLLLAGRDTDSVLLRNKFGLTGVDSSAVTVITDGTVCTGVTLTIDRALGDTTSYAAVSYMVLKAANMYMAFPHLQRQHTWYFVDTSYAFRGLAP